MSCLRVTIANLHIHIFYGRECLAENGITNYVKDFEIMNFLQLIFKVYVLHICQSSFVDCTMFRMSMCSALMTVISASFSTPHLDSNKSSKIDCYGFRFTGFWSQ